MNWWRIGILAVALTAVTAPAPAAEKDKQPEHCERLVREIRTAVDGHMRGDTTNRVAVALNAHMRLLCDPLALLDVLKIPRSRGAAKPQ